MPCTLSSALCSFSGLDLIWYWQPRPNPWTLLCEAWLDDSSQIYSLGFHTAFGSAVPQSVTSFFFSRQLFGQVWVTHTCNPTTWEAESDGLLLWGHLGLHRLHNEILYLHPSCPRQPFYGPVHVINTAQTGLPRPLPSFQLEWDVWPSSQPHLWESSSHRLLSP